MTRWRWGSHDCTAWPARWAGIELPPYSTELEAAVAVQEAGDLLTLWREFIDGRLHEVEEPREGDVGVIRALGLAGDTQVGAIFTGKRWAFLTPNGLACAHAEPVAIWRVECPKP